MGSVWQALVYGFAGIRPGRDLLQVDPKLPKALAALQIPVRFRGTRIRVRIERAFTTLQAERAIEIEVPGAPGPIGVGPSGVRIRRGNGGWEVEAR
jgi:alpha,alpha-trehalose phosphorylase